MSSRSIEGENPLYLPQAKIYLGGCALGPAIRPAWEITDPYDLGIELTIRRDGAVAWHGQASTASLRRKFDELVGYLMRADIHPDGVVLATGTCLVPPAPFSLADGDVVTVAVAGVGTLTTGVVRGLDRMREAFGRAHCRMRRAPAGSATPLLQPHIMHRTGERNDGDVTSPWSGPWQSQSLWLTAPVRPVFCGGG